MRTTHVHRTRIPKVMRLGAVVLGALSAGSLPTPSMALPHGCISVTNDYELSVDVARHSAGFALYRNKPCTFYYSPGDTYSGTGEYVITCSSGGRVNDPLAQGPVVQQPLPCEPGDEVTIYANQPFRGGAVVAGSLT
jgi:hypothetical protein